MLVLKNCDVRRILGCEPEPVEKPRKLLRAKEPGHIPQQSLEELLGDNMALEAEQVRRMNQPDNRSLELGQLSEVFSRIRALQGKHKALQGKVWALRDSKRALQQSRVKCTELQEENQQLRKEVEELGIQLRKEKANSQHLETLKDDLEGEVDGLIKIIDTLILNRATQNQQTVEEKQPEALAEQQKQLTEVQEALLQEQEAKALVAQENERLRQEVDRLTSWTELLQGEQEELRTQKQELQASLKNVEQNYRICHNLYGLLKEEQRHKEISLTKLSVQCESLTRLRRNLEEERRHLWSQIDTLKELNQSLLEERETWTQSREALKTMSTGRVEEEDVTTDAHEAQDPAPRTSKRWRPGRAFLRFFQRRRDGSRGQAKSPRQSPPGSLEATPACSCWLEERDARSGPPPKGHSQVPDDLPRYLVEPPRSPDPRPPEARQAHQPGDKGGCPPALCPQDCQHLRGTLLEAD